MKIAVYYLPLILMCMSGCALNDEGAVDVRRSINPGLSATPTADEKVWCLTCEEMETSDTKLIGGARIAVNETISIKIKTVYVKEFRESDNIVSLDYLESKRTNRLGKTSRRSKAEVAVMANIKEAEADGSSSIDSFEEGRVVFYSDDVIADQKLNLHNIPIYGPVKYNGRAVYVRFTMYEVDADSEYVSKIMETLSDAGGKAYPAASEALGILNNVGQSIANNSKKGSDRFFEHRLVFDGSAGNGGIRHSQLRTGDYVLLRAQARDDQPDWNFVYYDPMTGYLKCRQIPQDKYDNGKCDPHDSIYRGGSYIVFSVNSGEPAGGFQFNTRLAELEKNLAGADKISDQQRLIGNISATLASDAWFKASERYINAASSSPDPTVQNEYALLALKSVSRAFFTGGTNGVVAEDEDKIIILQRFSGLYDTDLLTEQDKQLLSGIYPTTFVQKFGNATGAFDESVAANFIQALSAKYKKPKPTT